jgi:AraC-like DNA-binding protein
MKHPSEEIAIISSIGQLHQLLGFEKPKHPLVSLVDTAKMSLPEEMSGRKFSADFYSISMKGGHCGLQYGRNIYDFEEGVLGFTAPGQVVSSTGRESEEDRWGWMLFFHPDLIRRSSLGQHIDEYTFFSYDTHEALHLSDQEKTTLTNCVDLIKSEYDQRIDNHSQKVMISSLELLLDYCSRFYERQFNTRTNQNKDILSQLERILKDYFNADLLMEKGPPSVQYCADKVNLSANYLSDLLRKETGKNAKEHINEFLIDKAKTWLLNSNDSVSQIAYGLGFNYPHYFSRLFKAKTGISPQKYRERK